MQVILLKDVRKIGRKYDEKNVTDGYALNFLIPQGLAEASTAKNKKKYEDLRAHEEKTRKEQIAMLESHMKKIEETGLQISGKANDKGHLFAGIHKAELSEELSKAVGTHISQDFIELAKPLKEVGEHMVAVHIGDKQIKVKVVISALAE